ncbi:Flp pilus assembly protein CpaB [Pelagibacterium sediminicola]|uniref:Flp pilus assembly protein CpaB n=1 Tax=Pelagibacterium sediminicola TaxID=2248761 RepID=UPI000E310237|nr:Flp pilus assembly protein CpaB [Pelagibacterium sediminicola]
MKPARILLIVVALVAGGLAAFLATRGGNTPAPQAVEVAETRPETRDRVLVATRAIGLGQRLTANDVAWQDWPEGALRAEYITAGQVPDAPTQIAGAVARFEFFPGEPIREAKLVRSEQGYLSAVITEGMRAVSIPVTPESASGGYIVPNDRVDVVLTRSGSAFSETILANVRVLAIGKRLGEVGETAGTANPQEPTSQVFEGSQIATLELSPTQSETILNASSGGRLALVLRSVVDFAQSPSAEQGRTQAVRLIRYGQTEAVMSGSYQGSDPAAQSGRSISAMTAEPEPAVPPATQETIELR